MKSLPDVAADGLLNAAFAVSRFYCLYWSELLLLPPTNEEVNVFARVRLSVCLLARLIKNACMALHEMLRVDRRRDMDELINF